MKGSKQKQVPEVETEDTRESIEELSTIFSTANFECHQDENKDSMALDDDGIDLDIGMYVHEFTEYLIHLILSKAFDGDVLCHPFI